MARCARKDQRHNSMRRDVGNEVIVALAVIGTLGLAVAFGVILTISRSIATAPTPVATGVSIVSTASTPLPGNSIVTANGTANATANSALPVTDKSQVAIPLVTDTSTPTAEATETLMDGMTGPGDSATDLATAEAVQGSVQAATQESTGAATQPDTQTPTDTKTARAATSTDTPTLRPTV